MALLKYAFWICIALSVASSLMYLGSSRHVYLDHALGWAALATLLALVIISL